MRYRDDSKEKNTTVQLNVKGESKERTLKKGEANNKMQSLRQKRIE